MFAAVFGSGVCEGCVPLHTVSMPTADGWVHKCTTVHMGMMMMVLIYTQVGTSWYTSAQQCKSTQVHNNTCGDDDQPGGDAVDHVLIK